MKKLIMIFLCIILYGCADSGKIQAKVALEEEPIARKNYTQNDILFSYKMYRDTLVSKDAKVDSTLVYVFINYNQKNKLPKDYMNLVNKNGNEFIKKYCPNYPDLGFFERNMKINGQYIVAIATACHLE